MRKKAEEWVVTWNESAKRFLRAMVCSDDIAYVGVG